MILSTPFADSGARHPTHENEVPARDTEHALRGLKGVPPNLFRLRLPAADEKRLPGVTQAMLDAGADVNAQKGEWTALALASKGGHGDIRDLLLQRGAR